MNYYQRAWANTRMESCTKCAYNKTRLPRKILLAAKQGNVDTIKDYVDKDNDVNAVYDGEYHLSRACEVGDVDKMKHYVIEDHDVNVVFDDVNVLEEEWTVSRVCAEGIVDKIKDYMAKDREINALCKEESLLFRACAEGHVEVVNLLLQCPDIHLNREVKNSTPLMKAAQNGHMECVKLLLDSTVKCFIRIEKCWSAVINILKMQVVLKRRSVIHILNCACCNEEWDVIQLILQTNHHFTKEDLYPMIMKAAHQSHWDIICDVFKRDFYGKNVLICEVFEIAVRLRSWGRVEELIYMMDGELKLELPLVEAALAGRVDEVERLLTGKQYDAQSLNGTLLVVAAGGTTEPVAKLLMTLENIYTKRTFSDALYLATLGDYSEMFIYLLPNPEASYSIKDIYQAKGILSYQSRHDIRKVYSVPFFDIILNKFQENKLESLMP